MSRNPIRRPAPSPSVVVGYVRASLERQELSPEAQREALARWCAAQGARLVVVREDLGVSGGTDIDKRPGLIAAISDLKAQGAGVLLVAKRDRLARDLVVASMIERRAERSGARVLAADGTGNGVGPDAQLMRGVVDLFAQHERAVIAARTKAALGVKRARGERIGEIPYGYRLSSDRLHVEEDPTEQPVVATVRELRARGFSLRRIAQELLARGFTPRGGGPWHPQTVSNIAKVA